MHGTQADTGREQVRAVDLAAPVALGGALQLAIGAKGREAEIVGDGHRTGNLSWAEGRRKRPRRIDSVDRRGTRASGLVGVVRLLLPRRDPAWGATGRSVCRRLADSLRRLRRR